MTANPYEYVLTQPEMILWYAAVSLVLLAWVYVSYRKMYKWINSLNAAKGRWEFFLLPPEDLTWEIAGILVVTAANLFIIGLFLYVVV